MESVAKTEYKIVIQTANAYAGSGGKNNFVLLELTGKDGTVTGTRQLNQLGDDHFIKGGTDEFNIETIDVGLPVLLRFELVELKEKDPWGIRKVKVFYKDQKVVFPVYDWVQKELNVPTGEGRLHHTVNNPHVLSVLKREVDHMRVLLPWVRRPGPRDPTRSLPRYVDADAWAEVPLIFQPTEKWTQSFGENSVENGVTKAMDFLQKNQFQLDSLESYHMLYQVFEDGADKSDFLGRWTSDEEFGRQQLNGIAPTSLERCTKIPDNCQIGNDHVAGLLDGQTLPKAMKGGMVYMVDFTTTFKDVKRNKNSQGQQLYCPDAICVFYVNKNKDLVPIAIQLVPSDTKTIFTPQDSELDWLLAKMYFKTAFGCMHEWHYHFLLTHGVMESFAVAVFRALPRCHPVYKLLRPHLQTVTVINLLARANLILAGSAANQALGLEGEDTARKMYKSFDMDDLRIPCLLKKRGLHDAKLLPKFYYRDDATNLWTIIEEFVTHVLRHYYPQNEDISRDKFLQDMIEDIATEGIGWEDEKHRKGLPYPLCTVDQLIQLCTSAIYTSAVQHSAVNFPQYDQYKFVPNNPVAMRLPPHRKGEATMERIMASLPDTRMSLLAIAIAFSLSTYAPDEVFLGSYPVKLFVDNDVKVAIRKFKKDLEKYKNEVQRRNEKAEYPYEWLLPEKIANSISI